MLINAVDSINTFCYGNIKCVSKAANTSHGERRDGEYSAIAAEFLLSVSEHKKSLRGVKSVESPYEVVPLGREVWVTRTNRGN